MISIDGQVFGVIGEFRPSVKKALKLPEYCAGFELDLNVLKTNTKKAKYQALSTFPKTMQDITFEVDSRIAYKQLFDNIADSLKNAENQHGYTTTIRPRDIFAEKDSQKKRITYRIWISHKERTLVTEEINRLLDEIAKAVKESLKAERI
jgi:phenylalanyl-tRNA synthetase beta subunit